MDNSSLFDKFTKEKLHLQGVSKHTVRSYRHGWQSYLRFQPSGEISSQGVKDWLISLAEAGQSPATINNRSRTMSVFSKWLFENGHIPSQIHCPQKRTEKRVLSTYMRDEVKRLLSYRTDDRVLKRIQVLLALMADTGCRASEALALKRSDVNFDDLTVKLHGKGNKQRIVPLSAECRKKLRAWLKTHDHDVVFATRDGNPMLYDNARGDFLELLKRCGIEKSEGSFHAFRRFFGKNYIKGGGNPIYLQAAFGHTTLDMTRKYVEANIEDLQEAHKTLSPLEAAMRSNER